jgi:hypothetical protein
MKPVRYSLSMILAVSMSCFLAAAQQGATTQSSASVPRLVGFTGKAADAQGKPLAAEQANEIVCSSTTACKTGFVPLFSTNGGSAKVNDSIITQSGSTVSVAGTENVTGAIFANGNAGQARTSGGWVKAMVYYSGLSNGIAYCYNSTVSGPAATTPPCGFTPTRFNTGDYQIDFGFQVDDRFFSVGGSGGVDTICTDTNAAPFCAGTTVNANQAEILLHTWNGGSLFDSKFYLIVY